MSNARGGTVAGAAGAALTLALAAALSPSPQGLEAIKVHEGVRTTAYLDAVGVPTICYGSTKGVYLGQKATLAECEHRLVQDSTYAGKAVARAVQVPLTQGQYDALVSFVYNIGETKFYRSTLLKRMNAGECMLAGYEFSRWVYAGDKKLQGLVKRRAAERKQWEEGCPAWG